MEAIAAGRSSYARGRPPLVVLVACSSRKRIPTDPLLRLRSIKSKYVHTRLGKWTSRLADVEAASTPAVGLYAGEHWLYSRLAYEVALAWNRESRLWVMSAGYGIVSAETAVKSYGATFANGHEDSVYRGRSTSDRRKVIAAWWSGLPHESTVGNLLDHPSMPIVLIAGGSDYVDALSTEIESVDANHLDRMFVISAGTRGTPGLLPVRGSYSGAIGGSLAALNARVLAFLVGSANEHGFARGEMEAMLRELGSPVTRQPKRRSASDGEIAVAISALRAVRPAHSYTSALRALRSQDLACESSRFKSLWANATSTD